MNKAIIVFSCFAVLYCAGCQESVAKKERKSVVVRRDASITAQNAFSDLFLDSMQVESFIAKKQIDSATAQDFRSFYMARNYQFAWFNQNGLNEPGQSFWNLLNSFISLSKDSSLFDKKLASQLTAYSDKEHLPNDRGALTATELGLTRQFFIYAKVAYSGKIDPHELQWFIPKKKVDALAVLNTLMKNNGKEPDAWEPLNPAYQDLKKELLKLNAVADKGGWPEIPFEDKKGASLKIKSGSKDPIIKPLKQRLVLGGYMTQADSTDVYDSSTVAGVKLAQEAFGFNQDGIVDKDLIKALNVPVKERVETVLINLERMRWLPEKFAPTRIVANIPEFKIHVFNDNHEDFEMNIVVGKEGNSTVIFNDELKYVVFRPYWNVPASIVKKEILPAMKKNPNYLAKENMEITGHEGGLPVIRQKPGGKNALGKVKFLFPNNYNIYFHDTPAKSLFAREKRAFSHGCMRLENAEKMAKYLLRDQPEWTEEKIDYALNNGDEKWVSLKKGIPVFVSYFTAFVDHQGLLNFREDIYGHDKQMADRMFINPSLKAPDTTVVVSGKQ